MSIINKDRFHQHASLLLVFNNKNDGHVPPLRSIKKHNRQDSTLTGLGPLLRQHGRLHGRKRRVSPGPESCKLTHSLAAPSEGQGGGPGAKRIKIAFDPNASLKKVRGGGAVSDYRKDQIVSRPGEPSDSVF